MKKSGFAKGVIWTLSIGIVLVVILAAVGVVAYKGYTNASLEASYSRGNTETKIKIEKKDKLSSEIASVDKKQVKFNADLLKDKTKLNFKESGPFYGIKKNGLMFRGIYKSPKNETAQTDYYGLFAKDEGYWKGYSKHTYNDGRILYQYNEYKLDKNGKVIIDKDGIYQLADSYLISKEDFAKVKSYIQYDIELPFSFYNFNITDQVKTTNETKISKNINQSSKLDNLPYDSIKKKLNKDFIKISELKIDDDLIQFHMRKQKSKVESHMNSFEKEKHFNNPILNKELNSIRKRFTLSSDKRGSYETVTLTEFEEYPSIFKSLIQSSWGYTSVTLNIHPDLPWSVNLLQNRILDFDEITDTVVLKEWGEKDKKIYTYITKSFFSNSEYGQTNLNQKKILTYKKVETLSGKLIEKETKGNCKQTNIYNDIDDCLKEIELSEEVIKKNMKNTEKIKRIDKTLIAKLKNETPSFEMQNDEKYYALIIGNNDYQHLEKLDAAEKDAEVIADVLTNKYGFEVDLLLNADYDTTVNSLFKITNKLKKDDNLLIYYAGHGEIDKAENRGYWLPVDASYELRSKWISNQRIVDRIKATKAKHVLLIADSCFSGTLMRSSVTPESSEALDEKNIDRLKSKKTRLVITSGGNEPVVDSDGGDHSLFALKLIDTLKNNNTVINSQMLFENIRRYVISNADQTPERALVHKTGHDGGDFLFFPKK